MDAINIRQLRKSFAARPVLVAVDLTVTAGSVHALLGPNGAGKTTLINILATLLRPDSGSARVLGHDVTTEPDAVRRSISLTGQHAAVDPLLTGTENLQLVARLIGLSRAAASARVAELTDQFELAEFAHRRVGTYSGGMRRRLDLALGLVGSPLVIFLDEPTTGLDTVSRQGMWAIIQRLAADGVSVLLTTQYLEEADHLADRISLLHGGRIVAEGSPSQLKALVGNERVEVRRIGDDVLLAEEPVDGSPGSVRAALDRIGPAEDAYVVLRKPTLDDAFIQLTSAQPVGVAR